MNITEIKSTILDQYPASIIENDDLLDHQIEIDGSQWLKIATFMKENPNLSFDQLECCLLYTSPSPRD